MKKEEMLKNIIVYQCYLESNQDNPEIKKALSTYNELFSRLIQENRGTYYIYKSLMNESAAKDEPKESLSNDHH